MMTDVTDTQTTQSPTEMLEMLLPQFNKQYLGLAGIFSSSLGYPTQQVNYISLIQHNGQTVDFEVCLQTFIAIKEQVERLHLMPSENLFLWVSVDTAHGLEDFRLFKSELPLDLLVRLYQYSYHIYMFLDLLSLIDDFKRPEIRAFAQSLLFNDDLMKSWFSIPASKQHHHSFPGGLMVHSLEVANFVKRDLLAFGDEVSREEREITVLAALLHDIGKTQTLANDAHTELGRLVDHEKLTLLVLAEPLSRLKAQWSKGAIALQYLLTWKTCDGFCKFIGGEMIKNADQTSTKRSLRIMGFSDKPDYYTYAKVMVGGQIFYLNRI